MNNKDLIGQYVDTGLQIPEYQILRLSNNDRDTYFRKRLIAHNNGDIENMLEHYEYVLMDDKNKLNFLNSHEFMDDDEDIYGLDGVFLRSNPQDKKDFLRNNLNFCLQTAKDYGSSMIASPYRVASDDDKKIFITEMVRNKININNLLKFSDEDIRNYYYHLNGELLSNINGSILMTMNNCNVKYIIEFFNYLTHNKIQINERFLKLYEGLTSNNEFYKIFKNYIKLFK